MKNHTIARILLTAGIASSVLFAGTASAIDWNITGFVRQEISYSIAKNNNEYNTSGLVYNDRIVPHYTHANWGTGANGAQPTSVYFDPNTGNAGLFGGAGITAGANTGSPVNCRYGHQNAINAGSGGLSGFFGSTAIAGFRGVLCPDNGGGSFFVPGAGGGTGAAAHGISVAGQGLNDDINFNLFNTRLEVDIQARFNKNFAAYVKVRGYYDGTSNFTDAQISDHFGGNKFWGNSGQIAEWNSPNFAVDLPAAYVDYNDGPLWIRVGNQTIAWGEAYFFRVMDVANGLDLRRHLALGPGGEEYSDQRVASPGIRLSYTFKNGWELDAFAQMWSPTILPAINTPYNVIGAGASLDERDEFDDARGSINFGARLTMNLTDYFTGILMYTNRRSQDGVARYAEAPTYNGGTENRFCLSTSHNDTNNLLRGLSSTASGGSGFFPTLGVLADGRADLASFNGQANMPGLLPGTKHSNHCGSPLAPDPIAVNSSEYWHLVGRARLDPMKALRVVVNEWPADHWATRKVFGFGDELTFVDAMRTIEGFHSSFGGFRAWVSREFKREHIFAIGGNYLINADPESIWDQLLVRGEVSITPNKKFTDLGLSFNFIEETEVVSALILEKYHRWTAAFPATYMVFQWMHRTSSDMFGRHLSGTESADFEDFIDPVTGDFTAAAFVPGAAVPKGSKNADYVVFAFQQPFPNLVWRFDFAVLIDVEGAYLVQPGVRYRPAANWQWDVYANIIEEGGDENDDVLESLDWADEIFLRLTYYF